MSEIAASLGAALKVRLDSPDFTRYTLARGSEVLVVDLVHDRIPQRLPNKIDIDGVRVDPIEEILVNKLTALVGRQEERDLVDVYFLEQAGHSVEGALSAALAKDGGCTAANLAWLLSQAEVPDGLSLPAPLTVERLRDYLADLVKRLRRAALPGQG